MGHKRQMSLGLAVCLGLSARLARAAAPEAACDFPYPDDHGNMTIVCHGLNDQQVRLLPALTDLNNKLLQSGVDAERLKADSDSIVRSVSVPAAAVAPPESKPSVPEPAAAKPAAGQKDVITYDYR